jgi:transmembrane sensor
LSLFPRNHSYSTRLSTFALEKYQFYTAEDFIQVTAFQEWVLHPSPATEEYWEDFQLRYPERRGILLAARSLLMALHESQSFPTEAQGRRAWQHIQRQTEVAVTPEEEETSSPVFPLWKWLSVAAVVLLTVSLGWLVFQKDSNELPDYAEQVAESPLPLIENFNSTTKPQNILLSDGSRVVLYPGSRLSYGKPFEGDAREVYLSGKGYFEVVKDDTKPFIVFANQLVTKVVGTSFVIDAFTANKAPSVEVMSGKVKVFRLDKFRDSQNGRPEEMVLLTANQQVSYDITRRGFSSGYVANPAILKAPAAHPDFRFENAAVPDVFQTLEGSYGVTIEYDADVLKDCRITVPLRDEPLFRKLDIICQTIGATYEVWNTRIVVKGPGCSL